MLSYEDAVARVMAAARALGAERVSPDDAVGRVLAEDCVSTVTVPGFDGSSMDGYAVRVADLAGDALTTLPLRGESRAGGAWPTPLAHGCTARIFTGAPLPDGADAVVMQEDVTRAGDTVTFAKRPEAGQWVRRAGDDLRPGQVVLPRGTRVTAFQVPLLHALERTRVTVSRRPTVAVVSTGDELRDAGSPDRPGSVVDCNGPGLAALAARAGATARRSPHVRDTLDDTRRAVREALDGADLVLTVGGVSVGEHDVVRDALVAEAVTLDFWKVAIKPGKPLCVGRRGDTVVLGLPGNPSSAALTFVLFGVPLLRAMQGDLRPRPTVRRGVLGAPLRRTPGRTEFLRATLDDRDGVARLIPLRNQASGAPTSFAWADALAVIPAEVGALAEGDPVGYLSLSEV